MKISSQKSFTLIEIIVVMVVLIVLTTMAAVGYQALIARAKERRAIQELKTLNLVNTVYKQKNAVFWGPVGVEQSAQQTNAGLGLSLPTSGSTVYTYLVSDAAHMFWAQADVTYPGFQIKVYRGLVRDENPCCVDASCPTLAECDFGICGDGIVQVIEECDDGNMMDGDGCSNVCTIE